MAKLSIFRYYSSSSSSSYLLIFSLLTTLTLEPILSLSLQTNPNFDSNIALFGDAEFIHGDYSVQLTRPVPSSSGLLIHTKPFKFLESKSNHPPKPTSFSTDLTFSISLQNGDGLALIIVPTDFPQKFSRKNAFGISRENRFLGIEFDIDLIQIEVNTLVYSGVCNVSSIDLVLNSGVEVQSWIDYEASSKQLEIRLTKLGNERPYDPFLTYAIDLSEMWKEEEVVVGLSSSNGNSSQTSTVHSWGFRVRDVPDSMHSQPLDPRKYSDEDDDLKILVHKKRYCPLGVLYGFVFAAGCGALVAFTLLLLWKIFMNGDHNKIVSKEFSLGPTDFRYEKVNVVVENKGAFGNLGKPAIAM